VLTTTCLSRLWRVIAVTSALVAAGIGLAGKPQLAAALVQGHATARHATAGQATAGQATAGRVFELPGESVRALGVDPRTRTIWAGVSTTGKTDLVDKISETSGRVLARFPVPHGVQSIAVDPTAGDVWVSSSKSLALTEIVESTSATHQVSLAHADLSVSDLTVDPVTGYVFVLTLQGLVVRITEATRAVKVIALTANSGPGVIGVDQNRAEVWTFGNAGDATQLLGFDENGTQLADPLVFNNLPALAMAIDPAAGRIWLAEQTSNPSEVVEVDEKSGSVLAGPFGSFTLPAALAADPSAGTIWLANFHVGTVTGITEDGTAGNKGQARIGGPIATGGFALSVAADPTNGRVFAGGYKLGNGRNIAILTAFTPAAPAFTSPPLAWFAATGGHTATFQVTTSGFPAPSFAVSGRLPSWLSVSSRTGVITVTRGHAVRPGVTAKFTITAKNGIGSATSQSLSVHIGSAPVFSSAAQLSLKAGKPAKFTIRASGVPVPALKVGKGLPSGLRIKVGGHGQAVLSGTPFRADAGHTYRVVITATNPVGRPVTQTLRIKVT
jgi:DNA-binding beta-propeller fold protein YncE